MLQQMRSSTGSWIAKAILGLLVLSFLAWGVADYTISHGPGETIAEIGDRTLTYDQFHQSYQFFKHEQGLSRLDSDLERQLGLAESVLASLINRALLQSEANDMHLTGSDAMVRERIENTTDFQRSGAGFDRARFNAFLHGTRQTEAAYVETVREDIARSLLIDSVASGSAAPTSLTDRLFDYYGERRSAEYLTFSIDTIPDPILPDTDDLRTFFEAQKENYRRPELRKLTFVLISPETLASSMDVTQEALQEEFERRQSELSQPELRTISQILFPDEASARDAAKTLAGLSLGETIVKATELDLEIIDLGEFSRAAVPNANLAEAAFSPPEVGISGVFEGDFGWSLAFVTNIVEGENPTLESVQERLKRDLALDMAYQSVFERGLILEDEYGQGKSLEEAAEAAGLSVQILDSVDSSGQDSAGQAIEGLPTDLKFLQTAFDLAEGEVSFLETTESEAQFMLRVDKITDATLPPFEEVQPDVQAQWIENKRYEIAELRANMLADHLQKGGDLSLVAKMTEGEGKIVTDFTRTGDGADGTTLPASLAAQLFKTQIGNASFVEQNETFTVARLTNIKKAATAVPPNFRENIENAIAVGMARDLVEQLGTALRDKYSVETYPEVYEQVYH